MIILFMLIINMFILVLVRMADQSREGEILRARSTSWIGRPGIAVALYLRSDTSITAVSTCTARLLDAGRLRRARV